MLEFSILVNQILEYCEFFNKDNGLASFNEKLDLINKKFVDGIKTFHLKIQQYVDK